MRSLALIAAVIVITVVSDVTECCFRSGGSRGTTRRPHDITSGSGLTTLYNTKVTKAERYERSFIGRGKGKYPFNHSGVVVTTVKSKYKIRFLYVL